MLTLNDGRSELWQWDTGRKLSVDADCSQVHFSNKVFGRSIDVDVVDGVAIIPDILLQTDKDVTAWAFVGTAENGYTKISKVFKVNKRNKPADYVFTPQDQSTLGDILDRIEDLENRPSGDVSKEDIQNAVNDYLGKNPISVEEKDPTVPDWAKQSNPPSVDIPKTLPNPHKLTFTGAVEAEYDGSKEVTVEIPEGGGGGEWELLGEYTMLVKDRVLQIDFSQYNARYFRIIGEFPKCTVSPGLLYAYLGTWFNQLSAKNNQNVYAVNLLAECELVDGQLYGYIGFADGWSVNSGAIATAINTPRDTEKNTKLKIYYTNLVDDATENTIKVYGRK